MAQQETFTQEELQHYLDHPEEVDATNISLVEALALMEEQSLLGDTEGDEAKAEADENGEAVVDAAAKAAAEKAAPPAKGAGEVPSKVLAPDGKSTIPFAVLKDARDGKIAAEAALADAQRQLLAVSDRYRALAEGRDPGAGGQPTPDELDGIEQSVENEAPWLKDAVSKLVGAVRATQDKLSEFEASQRDTEEQQVARFQAAADQALANNPALVLWQSQAPKLFEEAVKFDTAIRQDPESRERYPTFEKRYEQVVKLVRAMHEGEAIPLPQPVTQPTGAKPAKNGAKPSAEEVQTAAKKALEQAEASSVVTLSDIPGGDMPNDPLSILERSDPVALANHFAKKSPQDIVNFVMNGGRG